MGSNVELRRFFMFEPVQIVSLQVEIPPFSHRAR